MITFKVPSELYGVTDCVITDINRTLKTGYAPCGDGCDYKLTSEELQQLTRIKAGDKIDFVHIGHTIKGLKKIEISEQQFADIKGSGAVVIGGKYTAGKKYTLQCDGNKITAVCSSWFGPPVKSSFVTI